jgi:hypothetical protein
MVLIVFLKINKDINDLGVLKNIRSDDWKTPGSEEKRN